MSSEQRMDKQDSIRKTDLILLRKYINAIPAGSIPPYLYNFVESGLELLLVESLDRVQELRDDVAVGVALAGDLLEDHLLDGAAVVEDPLAVGLLQG